MTKFLLLGVSIVLWGGLFFLPLLIAVAVTILPSLGYEPSLLEREFSLGHWSFLLEDEVFKKSLWQTLLIGWSSACTALVGALALSALLYRYVRKLVKWLAVFMAIPHAGFALGFSFLLAPAGWIIRIIEGLFGISGLGGHASPFLFLDDWGISLFIVLVLKDLPFLCFIILGSFRNNEMERYLLAAKSLGYNRFAAWRRVLAPLVVKRIRLAFFIVIAYSLSVVDMAIIVGPQQPPMLSLLLLELYRSGDTVMRFQACAGAIVLAFMIMMSIGGVFLVTWIWKKLSVGRLPQGKRFNFADRLFQLSGWVSAMALVSLTLGSLAVNLLWSITKQWRYPSILPSSYTFKYWERALFSNNFSVSGLNGGTFTFAGILNGEVFAMLLKIPFISTIIIAMISAFASLIVSLFILETTHFLKKRILVEGIYVSFLLPLILPETILLFGITFIVVFFSIHGNLWLIAWAHFLYTLPYLMLTLRGSYKNYDERYSTLGRMFSGSYWKTYWRIKVPILLRGMAVAFAIAFSVSVAQYLSTELVGGGRLVTITTEAVNLSAGLNRRVIGVYAVLQMLLPMAVFFLAFFVFRPVNEVTKAKPYNLYKPLPKP